MALQKKIMKKTNRFRKFVNLFKVAFVHRSHEPFANPLPHMLAGKFANLQLCHRSFFPVWFDQRVFTG